MYRALTSTVKQIFGNCNFAISLTVGVLSNCHMLVMHRVGSTPIICGILNIHDEFCLRGYLVRTWVAVHLNCVVSDKNATVVRHLRILTVSNGASFLA